MADSERKKFERLKAKHNSPITNEIDYKRKPISENVRIAVWRRDQGKCVSCGSRENLEYDHIIPISRGGNNTVRNIELLCEKCNRTKHDKIL
jgi:5-methylcytosine-specific restriction endonuclease McrA